MIEHARAEEFLQGLPDDAVHLIATDPPYYGIVLDTWDNQWFSADDYAAWLVRLLGRALPKLTRTGSLVVFQALGKHGQDPIFDVKRGLEKQGYTFRNWITWGKRRAYGKSHDYLYCREEILWFSKSAERTEVTFNIPLLNEKRGYKGWNSRYPAKSEFKRVSNVWTDIPELMKPERTAQKPLELMERIILTHSNEGDLVVDPFVGWGTTAIAAKKLKRRFRGCEAIKVDAELAQERYEA